MPSGPSLGIPTLDPSVPGPSGLWEGKEECKTLCSGDSWSDMESPCDVECRDRFLECLEFARFWKVKVSFALGHGLWTELAQVWLYKHLFVWG